MLASVRGALRGRPLPGQQGATHGSDEQIFGQEQQVRLGAKRLRNECANQWVLDAMTLQEAKSIVRHLGLTLRKVRSGSYRVNFHNGNEGTAYYTDNLDEAVHTAAAMARARGLVQGNCPSS